MAVNERHAFYDEGESSGDEAYGSQSELKKTVGSKKLQVSVTDISLLQPGITNGVCSQDTTKKRGRGRPKVSTRDHTLKKRGRPKGSKNTTVKAAAGELLNGGTPKRPRGRPKGSIKRKLNDSDDESEDSFSPPRKRGRPMGSSNKKPKFETELSDEDDAQTVQNKPKKGRPRKVEGTFKKGRSGRPRRVMREKAETDGLQPAKRRGRPKGSRNKTFEYIARVENVDLDRPQRAHMPPARLDNSLPKKMSKRGRPKKGNRGRPRKNPLPPGEELYKPRQWKQLGRPRKYPREEQPDGAASPETPRRGRGRPRKSESKKGAHLRRPVSDCGPKRRGRPPNAAKKYDGPPRKRGRPKGSVKNKTQITDRADYFKAKSQSASLEVEFEGRAAF